MMTDEELSELAEALQDACESAIRRGDGIGNGEEDFCPFGAMCDELLKLDGVARLNQPWPHWIDKLTGVPAKIAGAFTDGFDGERLRVYGDPRAFALGRLFREQYVK